MRIAIFDVANQDIGLKLIFPEADYYIGMMEIDKSSSYEKYNIQLSKDPYDTINDKNYDCVFIVCSLYDILKDTKFYKPNYRVIYSHLITKVLYNNNFKCVCLFDNYDYDYDPSKIDITNKVNLYFKRNYNRTKSYNKNVYPYPFIMFGERSIIETLDYERELYPANNRKDRVFFAGTIFNHIDDQYGVYRNRYIIHRLLKDLDIYILPYHEYIQKMNSYNYSLDLLGVGDPNKRTFEILVSGALRIAQRNDLIWPFPDEFCEETLFTTEDEFYRKMNILKNNPEIYKKCLDKQEEIYKKYLNKTWIRDYINIILTQNQFCI